MATWRSNRRRPRPGDEHPQQPRPGPASVRGQPVDRARVAAAPHRRLQRRRLRSVDGQAARRIEGRRSARRSSWPTRRQEVRRQSASLVRPGDDAGLSPRRVSGYARRSADPAHKATTTRASRRSSRRCKPIDKRRSRRCNAQYAGVPVTATEPVFGYMADALGLDDAQRAFPARGDERHRAERRPTSPPSRTTCASGACSVLIYNSQATEALTKRMLEDRARSRSVPIVGVTETSRPARPTSNG